MSLSLLYIPAPAVVAGATAGAVAFAVVHSSGRATALVTDLGLRGATVVAGAVAERVGGEGTGVAIRGGIEYLREQVVVPTVSEGSEKSAYVAGVLATAGAVVVTTAACHATTYLCKKYKEFKTPLQPEEFLDYVLEEQRGGFLLIDFPGCEQFSSKDVAATCETPTELHGLPLSEAAHPRQAALVASQPIPALRE